MLASQVFCTLMNRHLQLQVWAMEEGLQIVLTILPGPCPAALPVASQENHPQLWEEVRASDSFLTKAGYIYASFSGLNKRCR